MDPQIAEAAAEVLISASDQAKIEMIRAAGWAVFICISAWFGVKPVGEGIREWFAGLTRAEKKKLAQNDKLLKQLEGHAEQTKKSSELVAAAIQGQEDMTERMECLESHGKRTDYRLDQLEKE